VGEGVMSCLTQKIESLCGHFVDLEPYSEDLKTEIQGALNCDSEAWNLLAQSGQGDHFASWWTRLTDAMQNGSWIPYAIRRKTDRCVVGTTSFLNIKRDWQTVEVGSTFLCPQARSGYANPESKLLMLDYAFQSGARRVEFLTDLRNVRSQAAIARLGAVREGVLRQDRTTWTGHVRDSVIYSITDLDFPAVRSKLRERLSAFEPIGR
jgi:N-acetyltransferase